MGCAMSTMPLAHPTASSSPGHQNTVIIFASSRTGSAADFDISLTPPRPTPIPLRKLRLTDQDSKHGAMGNAPTPTTMSSPLSNSGGPAAANPSPATLRKDLKAVKEEELSPLRIIDLSC